MPEVIIDGGIRKKVACGPCIRGHRSSKCNHRDRLMVEVRKPGRPLTSSCPHTEPGCDCVQYKYTYTIPKNSDCHCNGVPIAIPNTVGNSTEASGRAQKRLRKSSITGSTLERGLVADPQLLQQISVDRILSSSDSSRTVSTTSSTDSIPRPTPTTDQNAGTSQSKPEPIRFGFMGIGAPMGQFHNRQDPIGWDAPYPDYYNHEQSAPNRQHRVPPRRANNLNLPWADEHSMQNMEPASRAEDHRHLLSVHGIPPPDHTIHEHSQQPLLQNNFMPMMPAGAQDRFMPQYDNSIDMGMVNPPPEPFSNGYPRMSNATGVPLPVDGVSSPVQYPVTQAAAPFVNDGHNCSCGNGCECIGCPSHPMNSTTMEYVRYHTGFMRDQGGASNFPHQQAPPFDFTNYERFVADPHSTTGPLSPTTEGHAIMGPPSAPTSHSYSQWQTPFTPTLELENFHLQSPFVDQTPISPHATESTIARNLSPELAVLPRSTHPKPQIHHASFTQPDPSFTQSFQSAHNSIGPPVQQDDATRSSTATIPRPTSNPADEEPDFISTSTLSPSDFIVAEYPMPCCGDAPGMCQCGDRCGCPGCLTHNEKARNRAEGTLDVESLERAVASGSCCGGREPEPALDTNGGVRGLKVEGVGTPFSTQHENGVKFEKADEVRRGCCC
ncbi:hypothetical protein P152DRAFT_456068 [Eremomyces bilateralis CBS 781.70]|uniref:Copper-fist domain-containing protein n=1 Tax=Eremomyces bilateralis CBS 781.70 TaxID=1392243 RepID=A0A6G1GAG6_9PEZI|nr:uncharacterized protein P152DRAFT_456068 [Eremomyces bilateralis CBS 781.70]KAF1815024.1 hypothetical protein P152DRAFT_456068 [Eremomyces bilateralis CBS 781.70]